MNLSVCVRDQDGDVVSRYSGRADLAMAFALRFMYLHGLDPDAVADPAEGVRDPRQGFIVFLPQTADENIEGVENLMRSLKPLLDELDQDIRTREDAQWI